MQTVLQQTRRDGECPRSRVVSNLKRSILPPLLHAADGSIRRWRSRCPQKHAGTLNSDWQAQQHSDETCLGGLPFCQIQRCFCEPHCSIFQRPKSLVSEAKLVIWAASWLFELKEPFIYTMLGMSFKYPGTIWLPGPRSGLRPATLAPKMSDQALCHHKHAVTCSISSAHTTGKGEGRLLTRHSPGLPIAPSSHNPIPRLPLIAARSTKQPPSSAQHGREGSPRSPHTHVLTGTSPAVPYGLCLPGHGAAQRLHPTSHALSLPKQPVFPKGTKRRQRPLDTYRLTQELQPEALFCNTCTQKSVTTESKEESSDKLTQCHQSPSAQPSHRCHAPQGAQQGTGSQGFPSTHKVQAVSAKCWQGQQVGTAGSRCEVKPWCRNLLTAHLAATPSHCQHKHQSAQFLHASCPIHIQQGHLPKDCFLVSCKQESMQVTTTRSEAAGCFTLAFSSSDSQYKPRTAAPGKGTKGHCWQR